MKIYWKFPFLLNVSCLVVFFGGCETTMPGYIQHKIELSNRIDKIYIQLPAEIDTAYTWINVSDCDCCDLKMYRFANSSYSLLKETGMFYTQIPDSLFQLTISHKLRKNCNEQWEITRNSVDSLANFMETKNAEAFVGGDPIVWVNKELMKINNHVFILLAYKSKNAYPYLMVGTPVVLEATTILDNEVLSFIYECSGRNCEDFVEKMMTSLKTIKFE